MKILPVSAEFSHADGQTHKLDDADNRFLQFLEYTRKRVRWVNISKGRPYVYNAGFYN